MRLRCTLLIALALPTASKSDWIPDFFQSEAELFCQACEATAKERILSPSSYKRLECSEPIQTKATLDEFLGWHWPGKQQEAQNRIGSDEEYAAHIESMKKIYSQATFTKSAAVLKYEAANEFGALVQDQVICEAIHFKSQEITDGIGFDGPLVNGMDRADWSIERLSGLVQEIEGQ